jgi:hypothetical protein
VLRSFFVELEWCGEEKEKEEVAPPIPKSLLLSVEATRNKLQQILPNRFGQRVTEHG